MKQGNILRLMVVASFILILTGAAFIPSAHSFDANIPRTGQTTSYSAGDDGSFQAGVMWPTTGNMGSGRFNDNGDGTVTDLLTGLMWTRDANLINSNVGTDTYVNLNDYVNNTFNVSGGGYAGHTDWRIPNMLELESMTHYGQASPAAWLNGEGFTNVQAAEYWVSNLYADANNGGWALNLGTHTTTFWHTRGSGGATDKYVWTVRGGANGAAGGFPGEVRKTGQVSEILPRDDGALEWGVTAWDAGRFIDNADGTMNDNLTGLMWTKDGSPVSTLTGIDNMGITSWDRALEFVDHMNTGQSFCSSSIEGCSVDGDCAGNGTAGYCTNNPYNRCDDDTGCNAGTCYQKGCSANYSQSCDTHSDCAGGSNYCRNLRRCNGDTSVLCMNDGDCASAGGTCVTTNCFTDSGCIDPGVDKDECVNAEGCVAAGGETCLPAPPNYGYTDWRVPNFKEVHSSMTHWETERSDDDLAVYGFVNIGGVPTTQPGRGCGIWTSTTDPNDSTQTFSTAFGWGANAIKKYPKDTDGQAFCGVNFQYPYIVWPVREMTPDISASPEPLDFGDVVQGSSLDLILTINNTGDADLSIISIGQNGTIDPPFSIVSGQDNCTGTVVAPGAGCTASVRFSPVGRGSYNDTFDIESNDPDTNMLIVSVTGIGTTAYVTELSQTGQTTSYSAGDDGSFQAGVMWPTTGNMGSGRFNDNGDGTVTDLLTGLMWTRDANLINSNVGTDTYVNLNDYVNNTFNVSGGGYAGHTDWRIPNMLELESMTHYGQASPAAWLNGEGFTNVQAAEYWVSNLYADANNGGWALNLGTHTTTFWHTRGSGGATDKYVWTVRGGANGAAGGFPGEVRKTGQVSEILPRDDGALEWGVTAWDAGRFIDNADGTMNDNLTGLMWTKDGSPVSTLTGIDNMGITSWDRALEFVDHMNTGQSFCSSSIEGCSVDGDCAGNGTAGYCTNNPYNRCDDDTGCNAGTCYQKGCSANYSQSCDTHSDCAGGSNYCRNLRRCNGDTSVLCMNDGDCASAGGTCVTTNCFTDSGCIDPGVDKDECVNAEGCVAAGGETCLPAPPNYGYTDWRVPNFKEVHSSMTHWETERSDDDLAVYGFVNIGGVPTTQPGRGCGIWTSTTDPNDSTQTFSTAFGWGANAIKKYPKDTDGQAFCGVNFQYPYIVWPVRTAAAPAPAPDPDISVTPSSYDFGGVDIGLTSSTAFTVENVGNGDLDITSVSLPLSDFSVQSEDCTTLSPLAPQGTCTISVDFTPSAQGVVSEDLTIVSNDPDTGTLTVNVSGTGIPTVTEIDLELDKYVNNSTPFVGSRVTFTAAVTNNGPSDATGVEVKDVVPDGFSSIQSISHGGTEADGTITWSGLNINAGVTRNLRFSVVVHASGNYTNVAQVTAADQTDSDSAPDNDDGDQSEDDEDSEGVSPVSAIDLELDKSVNNPLPDAGSPVTFTVSVTNEGNLDATGVSVQDVVPDGYSNIRNISHGGTEAGGIITWSGMNINMGTTNWYDTGWSYRQKITINSSQVSGDLTDFPVLISTTDTDLIVAPGGNVGKASGGDIVFTNSNGTRKYDHEIESYNSATGELVAWVKVPHVSSTADTEMYMYYGNAGAADQWNTNGAWDSNYAGVWHFTEEQAGTGNLALYQDATANNNHGDDHVSATGQEGKIGRGQEFDGIDDYVSVSDNSTLDITDELTMEVWVKSTTTSHQVVIDKREVDRNPPGWWRFSMDDAGLSFQVSNTNWYYVDWPVSIIDTTWHHVTGVMNGKIQIYVDGILRNEVNNVVGTMTTNDAPLLIGKWIGDLAFYEGFIDEVRVSNIARSADWISTSFNNQNNPSAFTSLDAEEVNTPASATAISLTFDVDVNGSGNYVNVAQVTAADQTDSDSTPNNDDGDQSEDDEDNAVVFVAGTSYPVLSQPRTSLGDPYPCNLWAGQPYQWCDPATWPSNSVYAAPWDDADITGGATQVLAENFQLYVETTITEIKTWGGYWHGDVPPAVDNFTLIFHNDSGGSIGTMVAQPAFTVNRTLVATNVRMPYTPTQAGSSDIYEYTLTLTETLPPGTYWVEFFNDTTGHTNNNDFFWVWARLDPVNERGIDGLAWTNASAPGSNWYIDTEGNLAIEMNGVATGAGGCTLLVRNVDTLSEYCTIQEAYTHAGDGETIRSQAITYTENLDFTIDKTVIIQGGYDGTYTNVIGNTTLIGNVTSTAGTVTMGDFVLEQQ